MHITELRLAGFKSFVDPAHAPIEPGLTGIVGPNGCGKSNLLEAVRWVMGANSAKAMRAQGMDDVIFSGAAGRPPREHAEVTLVLANAAGKAPAPFHQDDVLEVSRRIRRDAGSTYRINGREVRAKDVQILFADAASGANSPALVRQGQVSELIAAKPENRRRILEDAAGIAGLHARRHEADLKLRAAEANLARLDEILAEIEAQALALKKQSRQAERYRTMAQALRETEALLLHRRWSEARERQGEAQAHFRQAERAVALTAEQASSAARTAEAAHDGLAPLRLAEAEAAAILRRLEGVRVGHERDLAEAEAAIARADAEKLRAGAETAQLAAMRSDAEAALARLAAELAALGPTDATKAEATLQQAQDAERASATQRAEAEAKLETLAAAEAARRARAQTLQDAAQTARARLDRLMERKAALEAQALAAPALSDLRTGLKTAKAAAAAARTKHSVHRAALDDCEAALKNAEAAEHAASSPYQAAQAVVHELEAELRALEKLNPPDAAKFPPVLAAIEVETGYERALAAALGDELEASTHQDAPARWAGAAPPEPKLPARAASLARFVKAPAALAARLALIGVVEAKDGAALMQSLPPGARLVSKEGDLWRWDGFVRSKDAPLPAAARLEHKSRASAARAEHSAASAKFMSAKAAWEHARTARQACEAKARALRLEAPAAAAAEAKAEREAERLEAEFARQSERRADLDAQTQALVGEIAEASAALSEPAIAEAPSADAALTAARLEVDAARTQAAIASAKVQNLVRDRAQLDARRGAIAAEQSQWRARAGACADRLKTLSAEMDSIARARAAAAAAPERARARLTALLDEAGRCERRRAEAGDAVASAEAAARAADASARAFEQAHGEARANRAGAEAHAQASEARLAELAARAQEQVGAAPSRLAGLAGALLSGPLGAAPIVEIERRLDRLKAERDAAGPVNLRAGEELAETEARAASLAKEKQDVAGAVTKLRRAIATLNNEGRARLMAAFAQVDAHFAKLFAALFEGGQASLKLTDNEDPLEAGLEILAQPPGKRLTTISLLSGGEQALTATALIFAVFLANPAPLCVLDEVDAPLDDANIDRFCRLLDEMKELTTTRFLVITHNPVTMSRMDRLYGVTMPELGVSQLVSVDLGRAQALAAVG